MDEINASEDNQNEKSGSKINLPKCILLFSGKRKCGKDFLTEKLFDKLGSDMCEIIRISEPIKSHWAQHLGLDLKELLGEGPYKEKYRLDMINWSEDMRKEDYGYFCSAACKKGTKPIWIVSDIRRKTDLQWFRENYDCVKTVRVIADIETRATRGWVFTSGVDDVASECDLDDVNDWDVEVFNDGINSLDDLLSDIQRLVNKDTL